MADLGDLGMSVHVGYAQTYLLQFSILGLRGEGGGRGLLASPVQRCPLFALRSGMVTFVTSGM